MLRTNKADVAAVHLKRKTVHFATACLSASFAANREGERATTQKSALANVMTPNETRRLPLPANPHRLNPCAFFCMQSLENCWKAVFAAKVHTSSAKCSTQPFNCITDRNPSSGSLNASLHRDGTAQQIQLAAMRF